MDDAVVKALREVMGRVPALDPFAAFCAAVVPYFLVLGFIAVCVVLFPRDLSRPLRHQKKRLYFILTTGLALLLARGIVVPIIRFLYPVARPFAAMNFTPLITHMADDPSFPSGHATFLFALAMAVWLENRRWGTYLFIGAAMNAVARVYVGVHWPSDVIVGAILGICAVRAVRAAVPHNNFYADVL